jgi:hypothetical protein
MKQAVSILLFLFMGILAHTQSSLPKPVTDSTRIAQYPIITQNYYTKGLSFFCKKEWQLQKLTNVNVFFRLGSKAYVDYLEQKPNAVLINPR